MGSEMCIRDSREVEEGIAVEEGRGHRLGSIARRQRGSGLEGAVAVAEEHAHVVVQPVARHRRYPHDVLAAELAAHVGRARAPLCLGLIGKEAIPRLYGLVFLLDGFGLTLRQRYRQDRLSAYLFLERRGKAPSEYAGATVREVAEGREVGSAHEVAGGLPATPALPQAA